MESPQFGRISIDPETRRAVEKAFRASCAVCGNRDDIVVRQILPTKPRMFCLPAGIALFVPLCRECAWFDQVDIEAHLLTCRTLQACERLGVRVDIED